MDDTSFHMVALLLMVVVMLLGVMSYYADKRVGPWLSRKFGRVYHKGHLYHANGSLYMGRYSLFETKWISARIHHIATADCGHVLHDHPWPFVSIVLDGGYVEDVPKYDNPPMWYGGNLYEIPAHVSRPRFSIAYRSAIHRHRVSSVSSEGVWTLFVYGKLAHTWGFYTPQGKIPWTEYLASPNNTTHHKENNRANATYPPRVQG